MLAFQHLVAQAVWEYYVVSMGFWGSRFGLRTRNYTSTRLKTKPLWASVKCLPSRNELEYDICVIEFGCQRYSIFSFIAGSPLTIGQSNSQFEPACSTRLPL